jgi:hypothetical protein
MPDNDLTIAFFLVGIGINFAVATVSQAGWKHRLLIVGLFATAAIFGIAGASWHWLKDVSPVAVTTPIGEVATSPVAWFVVLMFALAAVIFKRQPQTTLAEPFARPPLTPPAALNPAPSAAEISVYVDFRDALAKLSLTPKLHLSRLRIRMEWSRSAIGMVGWSKPIAKEIADFRDLLSGVAQIVTLTESREIYPLPDAPQRTLNWATTDSPIPKGLYRVRLTLVSEDKINFYYPFFLLSYLDENKNISIEIIRQEQFRYLLNWDSP